MAREAQGDGAKDRGAVQSVGTALRVAQAFVAADGPLAVRDVAERTGLGPSAAHRHLVSLLRAGLLIQKSDQRYDLGPLALQLGFAALARLDPVGTAAEHLALYAAESGATAMLSVWSERGPVVVRWERGARQVFTTIAVGSIMPLLSSATGRVFLAYLGPALTCDLLPAGAGDGEAERLREQVLREGIAVASGDLVPGLHAVAAPVLDGSGALAAVITAVSAGTPLSRRAVDQLRERALLASNALGYRQPPKEMKS